MVQNCEFQYYFGFGEIVDIFWGGGGGWGEGGHRKIGLFLEVIDIHFSFFLRSTYRIGIFFWGGGVLLHFKYILGMPDIPDIFWGKQ